MNKQQILTIIFSMFLGYGIYAQPCMPGWKYQRKITLSNPNTALTGFQVLISNINTFDLIAAGKMSVSGNDIRFVTAAGVILPFWIEKKTLNSSDTRFWVRIDIISASPGLTDIYMLYGNGSAIPFIDGNATFELFDDFTGAVSEKWNTCNPSKVYFDNGKAIFTTDGTGDKVLISSIKGLNIPVVAGVKVSSLTGSGVNKIAFVSLHDGTQKGYGFCYTPTANTVDIRPFNSNTNCFADVAPTVQSNFHSGNDFWQLSWPNGSSQIASAEGALQTDILTSGYIQQGLPATQYASIGLYNDAATFTADWFFLRKYAANENFAITIGAEVALPAMANVIVLNNSPICENATLQLSADDMPGVTFSWSKNGVPILGGRSISINNVTPSNSGDYNLTLTPTSSSPCAAYNVYEKVLVNPSTNAGTIGTLSPQVCYGINTVSMTLTGQIGSIKRWEFSESGSDPWIATTNTLSTQNFNNLLATTSYRAVVQSGTCIEKVTASEVITVFPKSVSGTIQGVKQICSGQDISLTLAGFTGNITKWLVSTDSLTWNNYASSVTNISESALTKTSWYKAIVTSGICNSDTAIAKITVYSPTIGGNVIGSTICSGSSGSVLLSGSNGSILRWEMSNTGGMPWTTIAATNINLPYDKLVQSTWYRAIVQNGICPIAISAIDTIIVDTPVETGIISGSDTVCDKSNTGKITLKGYNGKISKWMLSTDGYSWSDILNSKDSLRYTDLTENHFNYKVYLNSLLGVCPFKTSDSATIIINPNTISGTVTGSINYCSLNNKGTLKLIGQTGSIQRWERSPAGNDPWFVIANYTDSIPYLNLSETTWYRAIVKSGKCLSQPSGKGFITVTEPSQAGIISGAQSACAKNNDGSLVLIGAIGDVKKWQQSTDLNTWTTAPNIIPKEITFKNLYVTTYYRSIIQNNICPTDTTPVTTVTIYPLPLVNFKADTADLGKISHFNSLSTISSGKMVTYDWDFANGYSSSARNPVLVYSGPGDYKVKLNVTSDKGCMDSIKREVWVLSVPAPSFEFTNVCFENNMMFTNTSMVASGTMFYHWSFGDGGLSQDINPIHYYATSGTFTVKLIAESDIGKRDSVSREVTVYPKAVPEFSTVHVCQNNISSFINKSAISSGTLSYMWDFGDGAITTTINPDHLYKTSGEYPVTLITTSNFGCTDTIVTPVTVFPLPNALFKCANVPYNDISHFIDSSSVITGKIVGWEWNFGDTKTASTQNPTHIYGSPGIYLVYLKAVTDSQCVQLFSKNVEIYALPNAEFTAKDVCDNDSMYFINTTSIPAGNLSYFWDFGDKVNSTLKSPVHYYNQAGTYPVTLQVTADNGGKDTLIRIVTVFPKPVPDFIAPGVCEGFSTLFQNTSIIKSGTINFYSWDFGQGDNSIQTSPVIQYYNPGIYQVSLKATSDKGCTDIIVKPAEMFISPVANFEPDHVCLGTKVKLSNLSTIGKGTLQYSWLFGDGNSSIEPNPEHIYTVPDTFNIKLTAISEHNCKDSLFRKQIVRVPPKANAGKDTSVIMGFSVQLKATGGIIFDWSPVVGLDNSVIPDPEARPRETTIYTVKVIDQYNCENKDSIRIAVKDDQRLIPANIITPDGDGINDTWHITNIDFYERATVRIFNRWGEMVYQKTNYLQDWDGKNTNGDVLPDGTYYYVITFPDTTRNYTGAITILRNK